MIQNYRNDYIGQTANFYMTFPQTEQSQKIIQRNQTVLLDNATRAGNKIAARAQDKMVRNGPSGRVDIIV